MSMINERLNAALAKFDEIQGYERGTMLWMLAAESSAEHIPALVDALRAVMELHRGEMSDRGWLPEPVAFCAYDGARYPCSVVRAIADALGVQP